MPPVFTASLSLESVQVAIADLPLDLVGQRIVQLSDFHFDGLRLSPSLLQSAIDLTNHLSPDLIVLTGDYITDRPEGIHRLTPWLAALNSRCGTYAILGNHDLFYPHSRSTITQALESVDITVLWNQIAYPLGPGLPIVGVGDLRSALMPNPLLDTLSPAQPRIVLAHSPDMAAHLIPWRVDLQLSGHSHGGQLVLPGLGVVPAHLAQLYRQFLYPWRKSPLAPLLLPFRAAANTLTHWEWASGLHAVPRRQGERANQLYVNRGLGSYFPGRIGCPPELTLVELQSAPLAALP
jgi:uncharacterized protein